MKDLNGMKIVNFGSLNLDMVYHVDHFVRAGETLLSSRMDTFCGGKGLNQSVALARAGVPVYHAGKIGKDGGSLRQMLIESGADVSLLQACDCRTGHAIIQIDKNAQNCILLNSGANYGMDEAFIDEVLSRFGKDDILVLQNEINNMPLIIQKAYEKEMQIALNPSPVNEALLNYPFEKVKWVFINEIEGMALTGKTNPADIAGAWLEKYPHCAVVLTLGEKGVYYRDENTCSVHGIYPAKCVDTTAAGDTFTGYFISGLYEKLDMNAILRRASAASAIAVSREGAAASIPTREEVINFECKMQPLKMEIELLDEPALK